MPVYHGDVASSVALWRRGHGLGISLSDSLPFSCPSCPFLSHGDVFICNVTYDRWAGGGEAYDVHFAMMQLLDIPLCRRTMKSDFFCFLFISSFFRLWVDWLVDGWEDWHGW